MSRIESLPIEAKVLQNVDETALIGQAATLENGYVNDVGGLSRFPQLVEFVRLPGNAPVFLTDWRNDLVAVSGGRTYVIDKKANLTDATNVVVSGSGRVIMDKTEDELLMAAGGDIVKLSGARTELLSVNAPKTTHVAFAPAGYVVAIEPGSGRYRYTEVGQYGTWPDDAISSAAGKADNLTALIASEFGELFLAGPESIEQHEETGTQANPFFRRWFLGSGLYAPYTLQSVDNRIWGVNNNKEWVAFSAQLGRIESDDIQAKLERIDDWRDAWSQELAWAGQRFMIIQMPHATNYYGTKGVTLLFDYRKRRWSFLFGYDDALNLPARWPGWSIRGSWDRMFVGGNGVIYELTGFTQQNHRQKFLWRSGHYSRKGGYDIRVNGVYLRLKRGYSDVGQSAPTISMRANKDNRGFGRWVRRTLGVTGQREMRLQFPAMGIAASWQFEIEMMDNGPIEIVDFDMEVDFLK